MVERQVDPWRGWAGRGEGERVRRVTLLVGFRVQSGDGAVVVEGAGSVQRSPAAPNLLHFPRQRDRVGRVVSVGNRSGRTHGRVDKRWDWWRPIEAKREADHYRG